MSSPARWTATPSAPIPVPVGRQEVALERVGSFQKMAAEHADGRTFIIMATESAGAPGTVLRLAISESVQTGKTFAGGAGDYNTAIETTIANGYEWQSVGADAIPSLREFSADIRGGHIYIALLADQLVNTTIQVLSYDIENQTFMELYNLVVAEDMLLRCIDIACSESGPLRDINQRNIGHGTLWFNVGQVDAYDPAVQNIRQPYFFELLPNTQIYTDVPYSEGRGYDAVPGSGLTGGFISLFDGGNSIYNVEQVGDAHFYLRAWHELLGRIFDYTNTQESVNWFRYALISGAIDVNNLIYNFGTWDACYIDRFNYQVQAKWIRNTAGTGWDLYIGRRDQNGVFDAQLVKTVDYAALGVADIETEVENVGTYPETCLMTDEQGYVYCLFMFPDPANNEFSGTGLGFLTGDPYTTIEMVTFDGDEIYDPQNIDIQSVWPGFQDATYRSLKHMSATHRTDSQDFDAPSDRVLWLTVRDNIGDTRIVLYRN